MRDYRVRISPEADVDLAEIYRHVLTRSASPAVALSYLARIQAFLAGFERFPERGTLRDDVRPGLRIVGFERRISVAFVVEGDAVVILRLLYAGRSIDT